MFRRLASYQLRRAVPTRSTSLGTIHSLPELVRNRIPWITVGRVRLARAEHSSPARLDGSVHRPLRDWTAIRPYRLVRAGCPIDRRGSLDGLLDEVPHPNISDSAGGTSTGLQPQSARMSLERASPRFFKLSVPAESACSCPRRIYDSVSSVTVRAVFDSPVLAGSEIWLRDGAATDNAVGLVDYHG